MTKYPLPHHHHHQWWLKTTPILLISWFCGFEQFWRRNVLHLQSSYSKTFHWKWDVSIISQLYLIILEKRGKSNILQGFWVIHLFLAVFMEVTQWLAGRWWIWRIQDGSFTCLAPWQGCLGSWPQLGLCTRTPLCCLPSMAVTGSGLLTWQLRPPRGTRGLGLRSHTIPFRHIYTLFDWLRSHISPQVQGRECRYCLFMERGSNNSKPCF